MAPHPLLAELVETAVLEVAIMMSVHFNTPIVINVTPKVENDQCCELKESGNFLIIRPSNKDVVGPFGQVQKTVTALLPS